jgi:AraC-like DNA-binding protein
MRAAHDFPPTAAPLLFDISPLTRLRQQEPPRPELAARWLPYTVVVVAAASSRTSLALDSQAPKELYFSQPGQQALTAVPTRAQGLVLRFTDEFAALAGHDRELLLFQLFHRAAAGPLLVPDEQAADMAFLLDSMTRQAAGATLLREDLLRSYLKTLLLYCTRFSQQQRGLAEPLVQPGLFGRFQQLLEAHYKRWKSVAEYAEHLHVTANHLSVSIKKETGRPASEHIRRRIVLEAKRLISLSDVPLKEVAYQLGFEDVSHFSKLFKRCTGVTFSCFKEQRQARYSGGPPDLVMA